MSDDFSPDDHTFRPPVGPVDPTIPSAPSVIAEVWTLLDGECTDETRDKLRHHLEECPTCLRQYGVEERVKRLIATKCSGDKAPESLRARLRIEISRTTIIDCRAGSSLRRHLSVSSAPSGVGALAVVRLGVLAVTLLTATLGHGGPPSSQLLADECLTLAPLHSNPARVVR